MMLALSSALLSCNFRLRGVSARPGIRVPEVEACVERYEGDEKVCLDPS